jgi:hypothetical protein
MPRFLNAYDEAQCLLLEAVWERYASREQIDTICRGLKAIDVLRADAELDRSTSEIDVRPSRPAGLSSTLSEPAAILTVITLHHRPDQRRAEVHREPKQSG